MKQLLYLFIAATILISCSNSKKQNNSSKSNSKGIVFTHNLDEALKKAKNEDKLVFVDFYTSWCGPCKKLSKDVFTQEKVGKYFNSKFINCKVQCDDKGVGAELQKKYAIKAYPTLMFLNKDGEIVHSQSGAPSGEGLLKLAQMANDPKYNLISIVKKYNSGDRSEETVMEYFTKMTKARRRNKALADFSEYFNTLSPNKKQSNMVYQIIKMLKVTPFTPHFEYIEQNKELYYSVASKEDVDYFIKRGYLRYVYRNKKDEKAMAKFKSKSYPFYDELCEYTRISETISMKNVNRAAEYAKRANAFLKKYGHLKENYANSITAVFCNLCWGQKEAAHGVKWMEDLLQRDRSVKNLLTYAKILKWSLRFDDAKKIYLEIRDLNIKNNISNNRIDKEIANIKVLKDKYLKPKKK